MLQKRLTTTGGNRVAYLFHVLGYPWAVCSDPALVTAIAAGSAGFYARQKLFGKVHDGGTYPCDSVQVLPTLDPLLGPETIRCDTIGLPTFSSWNVRIYDQDLGVNWFYAQPGDAFRGLDGVHRVAAYTDPGRKYGFLSASVRPTDMEISLTERSVVSSDLVDSLYTQIDTASDVKYVWVGHECIGLKGVTGDWPEYKADVIMRGCFRSKPQYHHLALLKDNIHTMVTDVPASIGGHYAYLWSIPLDAEGSFILDENNAPILNIERYGIVSPDITTYAGVTEITINPGMDSLGQEIDSDTTNNTYENLDKYVFCRGDSGTNWEDIYAKGQKPHLYIGEFHGEVAEGGYSAGIPVDFIGVWEYKPIWLCPKNSSVIFNTTEELVAALNKELAACSAGSSSQLSGDGTANNAYITLRYEYCIDKDNILDQFNRNQSPGVEGVSTLADTILENPENPSPWKNLAFYFMSQYGGTPVDITLFEAPNPGNIEPYYHGKFSMVGGICQVILGLGVPAFPAKYKVPYFLQQPGSNFRLDYIIKGHPWHDDSLSGNPEGFFYEKLYDRKLRVFNGFDQAVPASVQDVFTHLDVISEDGLFFLFNGKSYTIPNMHAFSVPCDVGYTPEMVNYLHNPTEEDSMVSPYYHSWDFINHPLPALQATFSSSFSPPAVKVLSHYLAIIPEGSVYVKSDQVTSIFTTPADIAIGPYRATFVALNTDTTDPENPSYTLSLTDIRTFYHNSLIPGSYYANCLISVPLYAVDNSANTWTGSSRTKRYDDSPKAAKRKEEAYSLIVNTDYTAIEDLFVIKLYRHSKRFIITNPVDILKAYFNITSSIVVPAHEKLLQVPFFYDDMSDDTTSFIDWDSLAQFLAWPNNTIKSHVPQNSYSLKDAINEEMRLRGITSCVDWDDSAGHTVVRFRLFGDRNVSLVATTGRYLNETNLVPQAVLEEHLDAKLYNKLVLDYKIESWDELINQLAESGHTFTIQNRDAFSVIQREVNILKIEPIFSYFPELSTEEAQIMFTAHFLPILQRLGVIKPTQSREVTWSGRYLTTPGRENIITDPAAHLPSNHELGLLSNMIYITQQTVDLTKGTVDITYLVSGPNARCGYAPSCKINIDDITVGGGGAYFQGVPEDYYGGLTIKDVFFFDCFDLSDSTTPLPRTCSCSNYTVNIAHDESGAIITGTCAVVSVGGVWTLRVYCDTAALPVTGNLTITYQNIANVQPCQRSWLYLADEYGKVDSMKYGDPWQ